MRGQIDDIRIWRDLRSQEDIYDNRHVLLGGNENDLAGFWPISTGNGIYIKDVTAFGNHAVLNFSANEEIDNYWQSSTAPLGNELPQVRNILDGPVTTYLFGPAASNSAAEYGDFQTDAEGHNKAVMKRVLAALAADGRCLTFTGFKVGDLDLTYIGQAQSNPTLIGYIEGPPPVPSENATRPYYTSPYAYTNYYNSASVQLTEAENTVQIYSGESTRGSDL